MYTRTFLTNARYDATIHSLSLRSYLQEILGPRWDIAYDAETPTGAPRPGLLQFSGKAGQPSFAVRYPPYEAGHAVTISAGKELGEDIEAWLAEGEVP